MAAAISSVRLLYIATQVRICRKKTRIVESLYCDCSCTYVYLHISTHKHSYTTHIEDCKSTPYSWYTQTHVRTWIRTHIYILHSVRKWKTQFIARLNDVPWRTYVLIRVRARYSGVVYKWNVQCFYCDLEKWEQPEREREREVIARQTGLDRTHVCLRYNLNYVFLSVLCARTCMWVRPFPYFCRALRRAGYMQRAS